MNRFAKKVLAVAFATAALLGSSSIATASSLPEPQIEIVPGSSVNLVSKDSYLPVSIRNDYPVEIRVQVHVEAKQLNNVLASTIEKVIPANTTDTAKIPITAIVDGPVTVTAWLTTFSGISIGKPVEIALNVQAEIESSLLAIFATVVVGLGVVGTLRTIRKRRGVSAVTNKDAS